MTTRSRLLSSSETEVNAELHNDLKYTPQCLQPDEYRSNKTKPCQPVNHIENIQKQEQMFILERYLSANTSGSRLSWTQVCSIIAHLLLLTTRCNGKVRKSKVESFSWNYSITLDALCFLISTQLENWLRYKHRRQYLLHLSNFFHLYGTLSQQQHTEQSTSGVLLLSHALQFLLGPQTFPDHTKYDALTAMTHRPDSLWQWAPPQPPPRTHASFRYTKHM